MVHLSASSLGVTRDGSVLFESLAFLLRSGQLCRIEGPNGSGKTTLLRILSGLASEHEGDVLWQDMPLHQVREHYNASLLYLGHRTGIKAALTPLENMYAFWGMTGAKGHDADACCQQALAKVGLEAYVHTPVCQLSAGQQRRVALARLHLHFVPLWLLDEPFTAIDHHSALQLEQWIRTHCAQGGAVMLTSHQSLLSLSPDMRICLDGQGGHCVIN